MQLPQPYESIEERSPGLCVGRKPGDKRTVVIRVAAPSQPGQAEFNQTMPPRELTARAEAQARAPQSEYWVPILDSGCSEAQAYCVYPHYPDSLSRYLAFTTLSDVAVWTVMDRLLRALEGYRDEAQRPHGNIKPANVLLETTRGEWWCRVRLTDPLGEHDLEGEDTWRDDVCALGDILFQMVLQHAPGTLEIPSSDEPWTDAMGPSGASWRRLCADMMDRAQAMDLDTVRIRLDALRPSAPTSRRLVRVLALLLPIVFVPLAVFWWPANPSRLPAGLRDPIVRLRCAVGLESYDPEAWNALCQEYDTWLGTFASQATSGQTLTRWEDEPYLETLVDLLEQAKMDTLDPRGIAAASMAYQDLQADHPEEARTCGAYDLTLAALDNVRAIKTAIEQAERPQGGWPALQFLSRDLAQRCEKAGWTATAEHLSALPGNLAPRHDAALVINSVLHWWDTVGEPVQRLDERIQALAGRGTASMKALNNAVTGELRKGSSRSSGTIADVDELKGYIEEAEEVAAQLESFVEKEYTSWPQEQRRDWAVEEAAILAETDTVSLDSFRRWLREARQFTSDDSADWLRAVQGREDITASPVLNQAWISRRDAMLAGASRGELRRNPEENAALRSRVEQLRYRLSALDDRSILPLPAEGPMATAILAQREQALGGILARYNDQPVEDFKQSAEVRKLCEDYRRWRRDLPVMREDLLAAREVILALHPFDYVSPAGVGARTVHEKWADQEPWDTPGLPDKVAAARRWIEQMADISSSESVSQLEAMASDDSNALPVRLAAWRRLEDLPWPTDEQQKAADSAVRQDLNRDLNAGDAAAEDRRNKILNELRVEGVRRDTRQLLTMLQEQTNPTLRQCALVLTEALDRARTDPADSEELDSLRDLAQSMGMLERIVLSPAWPDGYDQDLLRRELSMPPDLTVANLEAWAKGVEDYRRLDPDPRGSPRQWNDRVADIERDAASLEPYPEAHAEALQGAARIKAMAEALLDRPPIARYRTEILSQKAALEKSLETHRRDFELLDPNPILPRTTWQQKLDRLGADIVELADGRADLKAMHNDLSTKVDRILAIAPIRRNQETIATLLDEIDRTVESLESEVDPKIWLERIQEQNAVSGDAMANELWLERRNQLLQDHSAENLRQDRDAYRKLRDAMLHVRTNLASTNWEEQLPPGLPELPRDLPTLAWHAELPSEAARRRRTAMEEALALGTDAEAERQARYEPYRKNRGILAACRIELTQADSRLAAWALPRETLTSTGGPRIDECLTQWQQNPTLNETRNRCPLLAAFAEPLFKLAENLRSIATETAGEELLRRMDALLQEDAVAEGDAPGPDTPVGVAQARTPRLEFHAAYRRLGQIGWPHSLAEMRDDVRYSSRLLTLIPRSRHAEIKAELEAERLQRWQRGYERLTNCTDIVRGSIELLQNDFGLDARQATARFDDLALHAQVNLALASLLQTSAADGDTDAVLKARDRTVDKLNVLAQQVRHPDPRFVVIQERMRALQEVESGTVAGDIRGLAQSGPGRAGWEADINRERTAVTFTKALGAQTHTLTFMKMAAASDNDKPVFLCTTEIPVNLFIDVCTGEGGDPTTGIWDDMLSFYTEVIRTAAEDPRLGPRTWSAQSRTAVVEFRAPPERWLTVTEDFPADSHYPADLQAGAPSTSHPMQYLPPRAAAFFALHLGCRLPTEAEWQRAFRQAPQDPRPPNLRGPLWYRQHQHIAALRVDSSGWFARRTEKHWPHADAFPFLAIMSGRTIRPEEDSDVHEADDGSLWLRPVPAAASQPSFIDMRGNVAEYTYSDPDEFDRLLARTRLTPDDVRRDIAEPHKFGVIGDSAFSPPVISNYPDRSRDMPKGGSGWVIGFSDVGIRPAFTAPDENIPDKLVALVEELCMKPGEQ